MVEQLFPGLFLKNQIWAYLWINTLKFYTVCFYCTLSWGLSKYTETKLQPTYFYFVKNIFKIRKRSGSSLPSSFSARFLKENISLVTFYYLTKFDSLIAFNSWDIGQYVYCNCFLTKLWRHKFWSKPYISNQVFENEKSLRWNKKHFSPFLKNFHWSK